MKILVAWDDPKEAEVLGLYLSTGENNATVTKTADDFLKLSHQEKWDAVLMALTFPTNPEESFALFEKTRQEFFEIPVIVAYRPTELVHLLRFLNHGLRFQLARDNQADFVFMVLSTLESAQATMRALKANTKFERLQAYLKE
jgi:DNA-binding response OmpR family regulator